MEKSVVAASNRVPSEEIRILRRFGGYLRLHVPSMLYDAKFSSKMQQAIRDIEGVRKLTVNSELGKISIHYDWLFLSETALLLFLDELISPSLNAKKQKIYEAVYSEQHQLAQKRRWRALAVVAILVYLLRVHRSRIAGWLLAPSKQWPNLLVVGALLYLHREHIKGALQRA